MRSFFQSRRKCCGDRNNIGTIENCIGQRHEKAILNQISLTDTVIDLKKTILVLCAYQNLKRRMFAMEATKIIEIIDKLDDLPYQKILIDGMWGIGKTKHIIDSIKGKNNIYYISVFGKKTINAFYEELYYLLLSKHGVKARKILKNIGEVNFSKMGFNISIPLISDIFEEIQEKLKTKANLVIVIDDLERISDELDIKEILGFIDSVTKNRGIKIVLVASSDNFSKKTKDTFENYREKSLDRIFKITTYAENAPENIMGSDLWLGIRDIHIANELHNLRTLEKTNQFVKEVMLELNNGQFNDKFKENDLYRICFAVVVFVVEHNCETKLLPTGLDETQQIFFEYYKSKENVTDYIWTYILKQNLTNSMMQSFIPIILAWFLTGDYSKKQLEEVIVQINNYRESKIPLYMSDEQIYSEINEFSLFLENMGNNVSIKEFLKRLDELAFISEKTSITFKYSVEEIVDWIMDNNNFEDDYDITAFDEFIDGRSEFIEKVKSELQACINDAHKNKIISRMIINVNKQRFDQKELEEVDAFRKLINEVRNRNESEESIIKIMRDNGWFLPVPSKEISYHHWKYCHKVFRCIAEINRRGKISIEEEVQDYFNRIIQSSNEDIFKYRLNSLIEQYVK